MTVELAELLAKRLLVRLVMAASELLQLIDLSLGGEPPCGVVNFNYMHALMHEIVRRLVQLEGFVISNTGTVEGGATYIQQPHSASAAEPKVMAIDKYTSGSPAQQSSVAVGPDILSSKQTDNRGTQAADEAGTKSAPESGRATIAATPQDQLTSSKPDSKPETVSDGTDVDGPTTKGEENVLTTDPATAAATSKKQSGTPGGPAKDETTTVHELGIQLSGDVVAGQISPSGTRSVSHLSVRHPSAASSVGTSHTPTSRSRPHMISASNELVAMERKMAELENRLGTVEALPDLLERKGFNASATPVKDLWNFTSLTKRIDAAEDGIHQVS